MTATGKNANGQTIGELDFYLADYRFDNPEDDYVLNTWEWFDLSPLGDVASISFSLSSSRGSGYNMITPAYFCMDNFNGGGAAPDEPPYIVNPVQDVVFNEFPQTIQVNLENPYGVVAYPNPTDGQLTLSMDGAFSFDYHVYSLTGQCVMNGQVVGNEAHLDMGDLNKGVYFLSIECDGNRWVQKVIVK